MPKLYLIRHGQASFGKADYDELSDLGTKQSIWLGEHFKDLGVTPSRVITGSLKRHNQTAEGIMKGLGTDLSFDTDKGWDEFDFHAIGRAFLKQHPELTPESGNVKAFFGVLRRALHAWSNNELKESLPESWDRFSARVLSALNQVQHINNIENDQPILVISSGGAIAMALKHLLGYNNTALINMNLQSRNTGISECYFTQNSCYVTSFNTTPHLASGERQRFITHA